MSRQEQDALRKTFEQFSRRLDAKVREFEEDGTFADTRKAGVARVRERLDAVRNKLDEAATGKARWESAKSGLEAEFGALTDTFARFERRVDAETMKRASKVPAGR